MTDRALIAVVSIATAGATMAFGALGAALAESRIGVAAMDALARQPDEGSSITRTVFVTLAMVESTAIFCLVIALILLVVVAAALSPRFLSPVNLMNVFRQVSLSLILKFLRKWKS